MTNIKTDHGGVIPAIAFIGHSNSGKTTLVTKLIARLTQMGFEVGSVKHHGHVGFEVDVPGKDSWRHMQAGAKYTVISSPDKVVDIHKTPEQEPLLTSLARMKDVDIIVVEGFRRGDIDTIELARKANNDYEKFTGLEDGQVALVTDIEEFEERFAGTLPIFEFDDIDGITNFVIEFTGATPSKK
jgi:molybdopterin-guanine dinucleotide biosynthesis protein MobB